MIDKYTKVGIAVAATLQDVAHLAGVNPSTLLRDLLDSYASDYLAALWDMRRL